MKKIWKQMEILIKSKQPFVSASIVEKTGSAPRAAGARMIICKDLSIVGTIGGGRLEAETIGEAKDLFDTKTSKVLSFNLTGKDAAEMEMICGGRGEILLVYIDPEEPINATLVERLIELEEKRTSGWLLTRIEEDGHSKQCLLEAEGQMIGNLQLDESHFLNMSLELPHLSDYFKKALGSRVFIEKVSGRCELYIFGAGHVAQKVAPIAESVGFSTIVIDDRSEFANLDRFPNSKIVVVPSLEDQLPHLPIDKGSYIAIMTRGHLHDKTILSQIMKTSAAYIGMIGSKHKRDLIYTNLVENENYQLSDFENVHCPIGLDILAETPEEIAISVVAELIKVRAGNNGKA